MPASETKAFERIGLFVIGKVCFGVLLLLYFILCEYNIYRSSIYIVIVSICFKY